jgi:hypothetical protein
MALTLSAVDKSHLLRLTISISIIFIVTIVPQSSFQSLTTVTTVSSTSTFIGLDNDTSQQDRRRTGSTSENQVQLLLLVNSSAYNTTTIPVELLRANNINCLGEGAIYIHGVWTPREEAIEQAERIDLSLPSNKKMPLFALLWEGNTILSPFGWDKAKNNADAAGHELADIIAESKGVCPNDKIRLIAHSLGSRVVLSALDSLENNNTRWKEEQFNVTSVHLMGAAVDDEKVSKNQSDIDYSPFDDEKVYGNAIERNVINFTNLYNPEDDMLERVDPDEERADIQMDVYPYYEKDDALGSRGIIQNASINVVDRPSNYNETNVEKEILEIKDANGDGECDIFPSYCIISTNNRGDNHLGYMGFRDSTNSSKLIPNDGDGAINIVVSDWQKN